MTAAASPDLVKAATDRAKAEDRTLASLIRCAVRHYLDLEPQETQRVA